MNVATSRHSTDSPISDPIITNRCRCSDFFHLTLASPPIIYYCLVVDYLCAERGCGRRESDRSFAPMMTGVQTADAIFEVNHITSAPEI